ncbi:MAG: hypothetical protein GY874_15485 [Desulfobacteraceae bacterium]|nr:hypothetical protein [Desulfobacteraceae bacterium]
MNVRACANTILARMDAYINLDQDSSLAPDWLESVHISKKDVVGIYQGKTGKPDHAVIIADKGLYVQLDNQLHLLPYNSIMIELPSKDSELSGMVVRIKDSVKVHLRIDYNDSDVFIFWRFVMRVRDLLHSSRSSEEKKAGIS